MESPEKESPKDIIMNAATEEFAAKGYGGARMEEIARRADVNKAAIYYHIGGKAELYEAVLQRTFGSAFMTAQEKIAQASSPVEKIRAYITTLAASLDRYPNTTPILLREIAGGFRTIPQTVPQNIGKMVMELHKVITEGVEQEIFRPADPFTIHMMVIGSLMMFKATAPMRKKVHEVLPQIPADPGTLQGGFADTVTEIILNALQ